MCMFGRSSAYVLAFSMMLVLTACASKAPEIPRYVQPSGNAATAMLRGSSGHYGLFQGEVDTFVSAIDGRLVVRPNDARLNPLMISPGLHAVTVTYDHLGAYIAQASFPLNIQQNSVYIVRSQLTMYEIFGNKRAALWIEDGTRNVALTDRVETELSASRSAAPTMIFLPMK